ncbi:MAG TPA: hypothetical protein VGB24_16280 [Longimicrobium sp.]|jgi:hypothetical protein|uniref:hypothetical protein n=1 Tax=Longimicrobium sp. TaxID=2029185 RepID=UPI002ED92F29
MADLNVTRGDDDTVPDVALAGGAVPGRVTHPEVVITPSSGHTTDSSSLHVTAGSSVHATAPGTIADVSDPELARLQIEQTRARMSDTIEQIEEALVRKRAQVEEKLDVMAPVRRKARENAFPLLGGVFLAGLVLGYLTGESDEDEGARPAIREFGMNQDVRGRAAYSTHSQEKAELWERRARRLMEVANQQEAELAALRGEEERPRRGLLRRRRSAPAYREEFDEVSAMGVTGSARTTGEYDGMPLHDADSYPPRGDEGGLDRDPLPAPV